MAMPSRIDEARRRTPPVDPVEACRRSLTLALFDAVSERDVAEMVKVLKGQAMEGDIGAMRLFFSLVTGSSGPVQQVAVFAPAPPEPTEAPAGSEAKILLMQQRLERGEELCHPDDAGPDRVRNGAGPKAAR
jgi:hypothetical protein